MIIAALAALSMGAAYPVEEKSLAQLRDDLVSGKTTSVALVEAYLARIAAMDREGPSLHSVIAINPHALDDARAADAARAAGKVVGPMSGLPILIKDNIETGDGVATTAGSLALKDNVAPGDAPVVVRLKAQGAVVLGKTNLSEWANIRSNRSISGWSAVGGLVKNPYALNRNACGSSSGTGAAIAASFAAGGVGTETDGSITCPASMGGLVGLKPTVGLVSRNRVVPISHSQDTPGPMTRTDSDAAIMLAAMAGSDPGDPATAGADAHRTDYLAALKSASLKGKRLGVLRYAAGLDPDDDALFESTLKRLAEAGAELVEIRDYHPPETLGVDEGVVLFTELKVDLDAYLASTPKQVRTRSLSDVIAFNKATPRELALFGQDAFEFAATTKGLSDPLYVKARRDSLKTAGADGIDALIAKHHLDALIGPTYGPAAFSDLLHGSHASGRIGEIAAVAGYPHLTVPMGLVRGLPVGFSFIGPAWSEAKLLALGAAFEALVQGRRPPTYAASIETMPEVAPLLAPAH